MTGRSRDQQSPNHFEIFGLITTSLKVRPQNLIHINFTRTILTSNILDSPVYSLFHLDVRRRAPTAILVGLSFVRRYATRLGRSNMAPSTPLQVCPRLSDFQLIGVSGLMTGILHDDTSMLPRLSNLRCRSDEFQRQIHQTD